MHNAALSLKSRIISLIEQLVEHSPENTLQLPNGEKAWSKPLIGFANGSDPLFRFLKQDIGDFYWLPEEAYQLAFQGEVVPSDQLTVVSWVIPQTKLTKSDQRKQKEVPCERWARSRLFGEDFNNLLRKTVAEEISKAGFPAVAPMLIPAFRREDSEKYGFASSWSERHTAYIAGLGTFGLSDGLITRVGKAIRCGSVIAKLMVEPDIRLYHDHHQYCLFYFDGSCQQCADRCPAEAINSNGHDKVKCHDYIRQKTAPFSEQQYGLKIDNCGLCQVKIACESGIPAQIRNKMSQSNP